MKQKTGSSLITGKNATLRSLTPKCGILRTVFIAFGSNAGDRHCHIKKTIAELKKYGKVLKVSRIIETKPEGYTKQGRFLNGVLKFKTSLTPAKLLKTLKRTEKSIGRKKTFTGGPREIDLDIVFYDDKVIETKTLQVPHPRMHLRKFVLKPLCEIAPGLKHPKFKKTVKEMCKNLSSKPSKNLSKHLTCGP